MVNINNIFIPVCLKQLNDPVTRKQQCVKISKSKLNYFSQLKQCKQEATSRLLHVLNFSPHGSKFKTMQKPIRELLFLIHGFSPVNVRLLITCDTAFYAIFCLSFFCCLEIVVFRE